MTRNGLTFMVADTYPAWPDGSPNNVDFWGLYERSAWEPELDAILATHLGPERSLVDIGAWIGPVTLLGSRLGRHVYAVEPDPVAVSGPGGFLANMKASMISNVTLCCGAIGSGERLVTLGHKDGGAFGDSMTSVLYAPTAGATVTVPAYTMAGLWDAYDIRDAGLIKMDVEGAEAEILTEAHDFLVELGVPLLVSLHQPLRPDPDEYQHLIEEALSGFDCYAIGDDDSEWASFATLLAVPK